VQHIRRVTLDRANRTVRQGQPAIDVSKGESGKSSFLDARETPSARHLHTLHLLRGIAAGDIRRVELRREAPSIVDPSSIDTQRSSIVPAPQKYLCGGRPNFSECVSLFETLTLCKNAPANHELPGPRVCRCFFELFARLVATL
jgi:hypothetical protein